MVIGHKATLFFDSIAFRGVDKCEIVIFPPYTVLPSIYEPFTAQKEDSKGWTEYYKEPIKASKSPLFAHDSTICRRSFSRCLRFFTASMEMPHRAAISSFL